MGAGRPPLLTPADVANARRMARAGWTIQAIADALNVSRSTIHDAIRGRTWGTLNTDGDGAPVSRPSPPAFRPAAFWSLTEEEVGEHGTCWAWRGVVQKGHPVFRLRRKYVSAVRLAWLLAPHAPGGHAAKERPLPERVRRNCRNNLCVNPAHLF